MGGNPWWSGSWRQIGLLFGLFVWVVNSSRSYYVLLCPDRNCFAVRIWILHRWRDERAEFFALCFPVHASYQLCCHLSAILEIDHCLLHIHFIDLYAQESGYSFCWANMHFSRNHCKGCKASSHLPNVAHFIHCCLIHLLSIGNAPTHWPNALAEFSIYQWICLSRAETHHNILAQCKNDLAT